VRAARARTAVQLARCAAERADAEAQSARKTAAGRRAPRTVILHSPVRLRRDRRPGRSDIQCPNDSPLRHRSDVRSDISLSKQVSERRSEPIARAREFGFGQSKPMSQLVFGHPLPPLRGERVQTKMSERECRAGRDRSIRIAGQGQAAGPEPGTADPSSAISHLRLSRRMGKARLGLRRYRWRVQDA
jgi:hypothetical protein